MNINQDCLTLLKIVFLMLWAAILWAIGVFFIRWVGPLGYLSNAFTPLIYAALLFLTIPVVRITPKLVGVSRQYTLICSCVVAMTAAMIDGVVVRWFPWIYTNDPELITHSAASLLWAVGMLIAIGLILQCRLEKTCQLPASR